MTYHRKLNCSSQLKTLLRTTALGLVLVTMPMPAHAATYRDWTGSTDSNWYTDSNWSESVLPTSESLVNVSGGANPAELSSGSATHSSVGVGRSSEGSLTVSNGATMTARGSIDDGTILITGAGTNWNSPSYIAVYDGALTVSDGATVTSTKLDVEAWSGNPEDGRVTVTGAGTTLTTTGLARFGIEGGNGYMTISDGGHVTSDSGAINDGAVVVTGESSQWTNTDTINIGRSSLTISNGATISTDEINIQAQGTLIVGAASGEDAVAPGTVTTYDIYTNDGESIDSIIFNHTSDDYELNAYIAGDGSINAENGTTTLTGDLSDYDGSATISDGAALNFGTSFEGGIAVEEGGTLVANDTLNSSVNIGDRATLKGSGTVGEATIDTGGILAPGNSIGTINVTGDVTFEVGSFYDVEVNAAGASDLTIATGQGIINGGTVRILPEPGTYDPVTNYTILTAAGGIIGDFDASTISSSFFLTPVISKDATNVYAQLTRNSVSFVSVAQTVNQQEVSETIDTLSAGNIVYDSIAVQVDDAATRDAYDRLSGEFHANIKGSISEGDKEFAEFMAVQSRLREQQDDTSTYWATYYGDWSERDSLHSFTADTQGVAFGRDAEVANWSIGVAGAAGRTAYDQKSSSGSGNAQHYRVAVSAAKAQGPWTFKANAHYAYHNISTNRHVVFPSYDATEKARYGAHSFTGYGEVAFDQSVGADLFVQPYASLSYGYAHIGSFDETTAGGLHAKSSSIKQGTSSLGVRAQQNLYLQQTPFALNTHLGWQHTIGNIKPSAEYNFDGSSEFTSEGSKQARDALAFDVGLDMYLTDSLMIDMSYGTKQSTEDSSHSLKAGVKLAL